MFKAAINRSDAIDLETENLSTVALQGFHSPKTTRNIPLKNKQTPVIIEGLTTMSWHLPPAVGSCRRGRRQPAADVARHRFAFSGQTCCP